MKANLLRSLLYLFSVSFVLGLAPRLARAGAPVGPTSTATQGNSSAEWKIEVDNWVKPDPGLLYVLDPKPEPGGPGGRIWLVDPETAKVMGSIQTGDNADFALSPDGTRLYVASVKDTESSETRGDRHVPERGPQEWRRRGPRGH
jgi:DNA-binding beta-propeller fold protein YncE